MKIDPSTPQPPPPKDSKLEEAAQLFEKEFLRQLVNEMRKTVSESGLVEVSQGERFFREELDNQIADQWGDQGGIGLADLIYQNIYERQHPKSNPVDPQLLAKYSHASKKSRP